MATPTLLQTHTVSLYRTTGVGEYDEDNNYIAPVETTTQLICNVQPYREGNQTFRLDEGYRNVDALIVRSTEELQAADDVTQDLSDEILYLGKRYFCKTVAPFIGYGLVDLEHYECLFYKKDKV